MKSNRGLRMGFGVAVLAIVAAPGIGRADATCTPFLAQYFSWAQSSSANVIVAQGAAVNPGKPFTAYLSSVLRYNAATDRLIGSPTVLFSDHVISIPDPSCVPLPGGFPCTDLQQPFSVQSSTTGHVEIARDGTVTTSGTFAGACQNNVLLFWDGFTFHTLSFKTGSDPIIH